MTLLGKVKYGDCAKYFGVIPLSYDSPLLYSLNLYCDILQRHLLRCHWFQGHIACSLSYSVTERRQISVISGRFLEF